MTTISYGETTSTQPTWYQDLFKSLLQTGANKLGTGTGPYTGALTAGFTPQQTQAGQLLQQNLGTWQPTYQQGLGNIQGGLSQVQQASQYDPNQIQQFMNPYTQNVVDEIARLGNLNLTENVLPGVADQYTALGQFGSGRQGTALAQAAQRAQREISGQQAQALASGYGQAATQYGDWANRGVQAGQTGINTGQQQIGAAQTGQTLANIDQQQLFGYGQQAQTTNQNQMTAQYQEWLRQQQQPWSNLAAQGKLFGAATPDSTQTATQTQFCRGGLAEMRRYADGGLVDLTVEEDPVRQLLSQLQAPASPQRSDLMKNVMDQRLSLADRSRTALAGVPEEPWQRSVGRAMLSAAAQGPANWGQLIGRSGDAYFTHEDLVDKINKERELARMRLEQSALSGAGLGGGGGGVEHFSQYREKDGTLWAVSNIDPRRRFKLGEGGYDKEIVTAATKAAEEDLKNAKFDNDEQRAAARTRLVEYHTANLAKQFGGLQGAAPAKKAEGPPPTAVAEAGGDPDWAARNVDFLKNAVADPNRSAGDKTAAQKELERITGQGAEPTVTTGVKQSAVPPPAQSAVFKEVPRLKDLAPGAIPKLGQEKGLETQEAEEAKYVSETFMPAVESARSTAENTRLLKDMKLPQGPLAGAREVLGSWAKQAGINTDLVEDAIKMQSVRPIVERMRNDVLMAARGVQTEGDAQRALSQFAKATDTPEAVQAISSIADAVDYMSQLSRRFYTDYSNTNDGRLRGFRSAWGDYRSSNLPLYKMNPKTQKPLFINQWVALATKKGMTEKEALEDWKELP